jgi:hypothetical protein
MRNELINLINKTIIKKKKILFFNSGFRILGTRKFTERSKKKIHQCGY